MRFIRLLPPLLSLALPTLLCAKLEITPATIDLGKLKQNVKVEREVTITNTGSTTEQILQVHADCSCAAAAPAKMELAPGESTTMKVTLETKTFNGRLHRQVTLQSTTGYAAVGFDLTVSPYEDWSVTPTPVVLSPSRLQDDARGTVLLTYFGDKGSKPVEAQANLPWLEVNLQPQGENTWLLNLHKTAKGVAAGNNSAIVMVRTSGPGESLLSIPVIVPVTSNVRMLPNPVIMPAVSIGETSVMYVRLQGWEGPEVPDVRIPFGTVRNAGEADGEYTFELTITPTAAGTISQQVQVYKGKDLLLETTLVLTVQATQP